jgi:hypothetical protein
MNDQAPAKPYTMTPDDILENAPKGPRIIKIEANVVAYFGDLFQAMKQGIKHTLSAPPSTSGHTAPSNTASAHSQS